MPENCPIACYHYPNELDCDECRNNINGRCTIERKSIFEIMTLEERIERMERWRENLEADNPPTPKQWDRLEQLEGRVLYLQKTINEHIDISKKKRGRW